MPKTKLLFLLPLLLLVLSGCFHTTSSPQEQAALVSGGVWRSENLGVSWEQITNLYTLSGQEVKFSTANATILSFDPLDPQAVYLGTQHNGLFYSYNYGSGWFNTLGNSGTVNDVVIDPQNNCTIYVAVHTSIFKSTDCSRHWEKIYFETRQGHYISALGINSSNTSIVYAGTSAGDFLVSQDNGFSWDVTKRFEDAIKKILVQNHPDSRIIYVALKSKGIFKSMDGALTWQNIMELPVYEPEKPVEELALFNKVKGYNAYVDIASDKSVFDGIIYANNQGIYRLIDSALWRQVKLLTPNGAELVRSVAVNPKNIDEVFYGTSEALYHTIDNGANWTISALPTANAAEILEFSPDNKYLYLGAYKIVNK